MTAGPEFYRPETPPQPVRPLVVERAFYVMLAGAVMQAVTAVLTLFQYDVMEQAVRDSFQESGTSVDESQVEAIAMGTMAFSMFFAVLYVAAWIWMAYKCRAGRNWARITGTVFFGLLTVSTFIGMLTAAAGAAGSAMFSSAASSVPSLVANGVVWVIGLTALILLWNPAAGGYFSARPQAGQVPWYGPPGNPGPQ